MKPIAIAEWNDLKDRKPAGAIVANVDLVIIRYEDKVSVLYTSTEITSFAAYIIGIFGLIRVLVNMTTKKPSINLKRGSKTAKYMWTKKRFRFGI